MEECLRYVTLNDEECCSYDTRHNVGCDTLINALIFATQLNDRQVADVLQCSRRRRKLSDDLRGNFIKLFIS